MLFVKNFRRSITPMVASVVTLSIASSGANAAATQTGFELWTLTSDAKTVIAIVDDDRTIQKVAQGEKADALDILPDADGKAVLESLRAHLDAFNAKRITMHHKATDKEKFRAVQRRAKAEYISGGSGHGEAVPDLPEAPAHQPQAVDQLTGDMDKKAVRKLLTTNRVASVNSLSGAATRVIQTQDNGAPAKIVFVEGADKSAAMEFIESAEGLSDEERAVMFAVLDTKK